MMAPLAKADYPVIRKPYNRRRKPAAVARSLRSSVKRALDATPVFFTSN